jgi:hypothetical protein
VAATLRPTLQVSFAKPLPRTNTRPNRKIWEVASLTSRLARCATVAATVFFFANGVGASTGVGVGATGTIYFSSNIENAIYKVTKK